ncbi:TRAM domain-containing protein, partial [Candidatus Bipolaricaulota bacterium]|nr:TRAM domain-containing protein [Candidatus Bipolaricaulota bacterium]
KKVLIENKSDGKWRGYTPDYFDTHLLGEPSVAPGDEVDVRIVKVSNDYLVGVKENRTDNR